MSAYDDPTTHQYDPRWQSHSDVKRCFTCHRPRAEHPAPIFKPAGTRRLQVFWKGDYIGDVRQHSDRRQWTFFRPGEVGWPGFFCDSRREAVDWLLRDR